MRAPAAGAGGQRVEQQRRKNPLPVVGKRGATASTCSPTGNRTIRVRSPGAGGPCSFYTGEASRLWPAAAAAPARPALALGRR